ncbi:MAG: hypothetical protein R3B70_48015, partial [Polyangiaceae bacterium]
VVLLVLRNKGSEGHGSGSGAAATSSSAKSSHAEKPAPAPSGSVLVLEAGAPSADNGKTVFSAKWGTGDDELGHERPEEGAPLGPMSLGVDGKGRIVVLDTVNGRLVRRGKDGEPDSVVKIGLLDPQDMALGADGTTAVLDRYADKKVAVYDDTGALVGDLPLVGEGISETGDVTGVFVDGTDVYAEREHGPLVKIGGTNGQPADPRTEIPGRPSRDGLSFLLAGIIDGPAGRVYVAAIDRATETQRFTREIRQPAFVHSIVLLDSDKSGTIYFATQVEQPDGSGAIFLSCLEPQHGVITGSTVLPVNTLPEESFRDFAVLDEGGVVYALRTEQGVSYLHYDCE